VLCQAKLAEAAAELLQVALALLHVGTHSWMQRSQLRNVLLLQLLLLCSHSSCIACQQLLLRQLLLLWVQPQHCPVGSSGLPVVCCCWPAAELLLCCPIWLEAS
jgi:hypothetical protein